MQIEELKPGMTYSNEAGRREIVGFSGDFLYFKVLSGERPHTWVIWVDSADDREVYTCSKLAFVAWIGTAGSMGPASGIPVTDGYQLRCGKSYWDGAYRIRQIVALECREIPGPVTVVFRSLCGDKGLEAEEIDYAGRGEHFTSLQDFLEYARFEVDFGPEALG